MPGPPQLGAMPALSRRSTLTAMSAVLPWSGPAASAAAGPWEALRSGAIVLFRHAHAPGAGDSPGMRLDDCSTQRNLDGAGRAQAKRIGERLRAEGVTVGAVLTSRWCRAVDTADLAFPGLGRAEPAFDSFFADRAEEPARTAEVRRILLDWKGPGALVAITHQVNITGLTGLVPASGEGVVLRSSADHLLVVGRISP